MQKYQFSKKTDNKKSNLRVKINESKFDAAGVGEFKEELDNVWDDTVVSVTIDFKAVEFIDSSGIGALLSVQKRLKNGFEPVTLLDARTSVLSVIELLRLHRIFSIKNS